MTAASATAPERGDEVGRRSATRACGHPAPASTRPRPFHARNDSRPLRYPYPVLLAWTVMQTDARLPPTPPRPTAPHRPRVRRSRGLGYGVKRAALGPALPTANLAHERLGKIAALAIFSSDALSSVAYATEEMLKTLVIAGVGALAFSLIVPLSAAIVGRPRDPRLQLPPDDQGLPVGGRRLHRHEGQLRADPRPGRRCRAADRLRADRRRLGLRRRRGDHRARARRPRRSASRWPSRRSR